MTVMILRVDLMSNEINNIKYIPISENIFCKDGWRKAGTINIGDEVYSIDGYIHKVKNINKSNQYIYLITLRDGSEIKLGEDSIVKIATSKQEYNMRKYGDKRFKYITINDLLKDYKKYNRGLDNRDIVKLKYSCLPIEPIQYEKTKLPLNPYLFGLLLGDGGFTEHVITFTNPEDDIWEDFNNMISDIGLESHYKYFDNHKQSHICSKDSYSENFLNRKIKELKLNGLDSRQKFIPDIYKKSCVEDRLLLLSGIINTDGNIDEHGLINICTYSPYMYKDIVDVSKSLGLIVTYSEYDRTSKNSTSKYDKEIEYRVRILENDYSMFKLSDKHKNKLKDRKKFSNRITDIQKCNQEDVVSIILDDNQRVILNNYTAI